MDLGSAIRLRVLVVVVAARPASLSTASHTTKGVNPLRTVVPRYAALICKVYGLSADIRAPCRETSRTRVENVHSVTPQPPATLLMTARATLRTNLRRTHVRRHAAHLEGHTTAY